MRLNKTVAGILIPRYDELTLYLMSFSFILLFISNNTLQDYSKELLFGRFDLRNYIFLIFFVLGLLFSLYHVFTERKKSDWEKMAMIAFAVFASGLSGIAAGKHLLKHSSGILMVFPVWNIANSFILMAMYRFSLVNKDNISDDNASYLEVSISSIIVLITFALCQYYFKLYWAVTFSICVSYSLNFNGVLHKYILRKGSESKSEPKEIEIKFARDSNEIKYWMILLSLMSVTGLLLMYFIDYFAAYGNQFRSNIGVFFCVFVPGLLVFGLLGYLLCRFLNTVLSVIFGVTTTIWLLIEINNRTLW